MDECSHWNTHRWCIVSSISTLSKAPPRPIPSHSTGVKFKILHQRDCASLRGTALLRQHNDNHHSGPGWQSYKARVVTGVSTMSQAQHGAKTRRRLNNGIRSVVLCISDESSGLLRHTSPRQSRPSVCSIKYSSFPSTRPSGQTSPNLFASHGSTPGGQSCDWQLPPAHLGARVNVWLI